MEAYRQWTDPPAVVSTSLCLTSAEWSNHHLSDTAYANAEPHLTESPHSLPSVCPLVESRQESLLRAEPIELRRVSFRSL